MTPSLRVVTDELHISCLEGRGPPLADVCLYPWFTWHVLPINQVHRLPFGRLWPGVNTDVRLVDLIEGSSLTRGRHAYTQTCFCDDFSTNILCAEGYIMCQLSWNVPSLQMKQGSSPFPFCSGPLLICIYCQQHIRHKHVNNIFVLVLILSLCSSCFWRTVNVSVV
jgi:hypothetical protein